MIYRIGRKKYQFYAFDIESHNDIESIKKMETSMWLGCFIDENSSIDDESSYLYNMNQFIDRIEYLSNRHRHSSDESRPIKKIAICFVLYFHNLSIFIIYLLNGLLYCQFYLSVDITLKKHSVKILKKHLIVFLHVL